MNRILNQYGALNHKTAAGAAVSEALEKIHNAIRPIIAEHQLLPDEIIALEHQAIFEVTSTCAAEILRKAISMRKLERANKTVA